MCKCETTGCFRRDVGTFSSRVSGAANVQNICCISTFISVSEEISGLFPALCAIKWYISDEISGKFHVVLVAAKLNNRVCVETKPEPHVEGNNTSCFEPKQDIFLTRCFFFCAETKPDHKHRTVTKRNKSF